MAKIDIDQIVKEKLDNIQFDFKDEYWANMEKNLLADCTEEVVVASSFNTITSVFLITSLTAIITVLAVFPWAYDFDNSPKTKAVAPESIPVQIEQKEEVKSQQNLTIKQTETKPETKKEETKQEVKAVVKKRNLRKKKTTTKKRNTASKVNKQEQRTTNAEKPDTKPQSGIHESEKPARKEATSVDPYDSTRVKAEENNSNSEARNIEQKQSTEGNDLISDNNGIDNDSIYIPDAVLSGNKPGDEMKEIMVDVEERPVEPKTVKPRNKPVKHVFKKRKGLLYRMGLRK